MPIFFLQIFKKYCRDYEVAIFSKFGSFPTCFGCFLSANTADKTHVDLQKFY